MVIREKSVIDAEKFGSRSGVLPLPSGSSLLGAHAVTLGTEGGAAVGGAGGSLDGGAASEARLKGLFEANSFGDVGASSGGAAEEGSGLRLTVLGDGGCVRPDGEGPRGRSESGISRTGLRAGLRVGDFCPAGASSSSHQSLDSPLSMEDRGVS